MGFPPNANANTNAHRPTLRLDLTFTIGTTRGYGTGFTQFYLPPKEMKSSEKRKTNNRSENKNS